MTQSYNPQNREATPEPLRVKRRKGLVANVCLFAVGHKDYWEQFEGLLDELMSYHRELARRIQAHGVTLTDLGMVDDAATAYRKVKEIRAADPDLVFVNMATYATSSTWGVMARELTAPAVLLALQPLKAMPYDRGSTYMQLANDNICAIPEFVHTSIRMGRKAPEIVIGHLRGDARADQELKEWCQIAKVLHDVHGARIGHFGHPIEAMLDMHSDQTAFTAQLGIHIVQTEIDGLLEEQSTVRPDEIEQKQHEILDFFELPDPQSDPITRKVTGEDLYPAARAAVALEKFIDRYALDGLAYYYAGRPGSEGRELATNLIVGNSLLTAAGFPMCGESDLKTCVGMLIMDRLEIGGSFAEFHPMDFEEDFILVGHDGPHHLNIAEGRPLLRSLLKYHGKPGSGVSVEFKIREGPITMLGVTQKFDGQFKFVIAEGESVRGPIPPTGNTNTRGYFKPDARTFFKAWVAEGPTHHFALGIGHHAETLKRIGEALGIESVIVRKSPG
jgi:L-arabinose isomerase